MPVSGSDPKQIKLNGVVSFLGFFNLRENLDRKVVVIVDCDVGAGKDAGGGGAAKPTEVPDRSGGDDDRSGAAGGLHDVPKQARPFLFLLFQTDVGVPSLVFFFRCFRNFLIAYLDLE